MNSSPGNGHNGHKHDKEYTIIVNARPKTVTQKIISYTEIVILAFGEMPTGTNTICTVTYYKGNNNKKEGTLVLGGTVKIKEGMVFDVTATDKS